VGLLTWVTTWVRGDDDMMITGKRHDVQVRWRPGPAMTPICRRPSSTGRCSMR
jgi:hypothetical protein